MPLTTFILSYNALAVNAFSIMFLWVRKKVTEPLSHHKGYKLKFPQSHYRKKIIRKNIMEPKSSCLSELQPTWVHPYFCTQTTGIPNQLLRVNAASLKSPICMLDEKRITQRLDTVPNLYPSLDNLCPCLIMTHSHPIHRRIKFLIHF